MLPNSSMSAIILDGKELSARHREQVMSHAAEVTSKLGRKPGLAVVLVGSDPASKIYVGSKTKAAVACGLDVFDHALPESASDAQISEVIETLNADKRVDGILLQLPLPRGRNEFQALTKISPDKDVDGLHPVTQGLLLRGADAFLPCTPQGCMAMIDEAAARLGAKFELAGKRALVVGRSILVGKPVALLLLGRHCTVTMAHSRTADLPEECRRADILIAAIGKPEFVRRDWIKPGAIVVDVGINRLESGKIVGDVEFEGAKEIAGAITPVPGGVGPMTITMLLRNTVLSAERRASRMGDG